MESELNIVIVSVPSQAMIMALLTAIGVGWWLLGWLNARHHA